MRYSLRIGESVAYPSYSKIISRYFTEFQRGRANSLISAGQASGPAFGTLLGGMLIAHVGWRLFFIIFGIASSLWLLPWLKYMRRAAQTTEVAPEPATVSVSTTANESPSATILQILRQRSAWGTFAGLFAYNYLWYFFITWLPFYLVRERHFSVQRMSIITGMAFLTLATSALLSGWLSDKWIAAGGTPTRVRKTFTGAGPLIASSIMPVVIVANHGVAVALLLLSCVGLGMCTSNLWSVTQTLAGPPTSRTWTGRPNFTTTIPRRIPPPLIPVPVPP